MDTLVLTPVNFIPVFVSTTGQGELKLNYTIYKRPPNFRGNFYNVRQLWDPRTQELPDGEKALSFVRWILGAEQ